MPSSPAPCSAPVPRKPPFRPPLRWLAEEAYPEADVTRVVLDNLNAHVEASLYQTFPPSEVRRIARRLEFHYTPKHGNWLNMAEIEFSVISSGSTILD